MGGDNPLSGCASGFVPFGIVGILLVQLEVLPQCEEMPILFLIDLPGGDSGVVKLSDTAREAVVLTPAEIPFGESDPSEEEAIKGILHPVQVDSGLFGDFLRDPR